MKKIIALTTKTIFSTLTLMMTSNLALAQNRNASRSNENQSEERLAPETLGNILDALTNQKLEASPDSSKFVSPTLNLNHLGSQGLSGSVIKDGIPGVHGEGNSMIVDDVVARAYNSVQMIELILEERKTYAMGPRVLYMENGIRGVLKISDKRSDEEALRETLNRGLDIMSLVLPITGATPEASAQWASNFYRTVLTLAAGLQNNDRQKILRINRSENDNNELVENPERYVSGLTSAKYGQVYANLLYSFSTTPGTRAAKAVLLMRLLGYLGHDLNEDLARRSDGVARTITDIYRLQNDPVYLNIVQALRRGFSPSSSELATLRSRTYSIISKLPERLGKAPKFAGLTSP